MTSIYDQDLPRNEANFAPISPLSFIERTAEVYPDRLAIVHGDLRQTWSQTYNRARQLASALQRAGIGKNDTVAVMLPNTPPMVEAHFGVPMAGAVLNALNTRLDPEAIAFMLDHGEAKVVIVDPEFAGTLRQALALRQHKSPLLVIDVEDALFTGETQSAGSTTYESFLDGGDPAFAWSLPADEWDAIALNYTSGTTGNPKGVVYHHRGAATNAISNILEWDMPKHAVYLWTLPMFHCNGWCFPWTVAARAGVNVCLRRVDPQAIFDAMRNHGVTHYCGAPIVHGLLVNAPAAMKAGVPAGIKAMVAGAAPPASMIEGMEQMGFDLTHVYGLTEVYGPATVCAKHAAWDELDIGERARLNARQGVRYHLQRDVRVLNPETMMPVPQDGETMGEIMFKGNITMKGYLKNPTTTQEAFAGGWFHSGDLAVQYPDGYFKIKDRSKDIIISGGENISSIEVEDVLYRHPDVLAAAVVARPDPKWGETPCAFVELKFGVHTTPEDIVAHCKKHLAGFKVPRFVVFGE
ncbi:MAG: acyl-CoA synthetase, partial [Hydrogenophaga sp.]|nr:acyl-CoA synthetase [Hydrogenophaga sp.]